MLLRVEVNVDTSASSYETHGWKSLNKSWKSVALDKMIVCLPLPMIIVMIIIQKIAVRKNNLFASSFELDMRGYLRLDRYGEPSKI